jgi:hypothetical protein
MAGLAEVCHVGCMASVDSFSIQDWVGIASLAVALAVPLSGGIVAGFVTEIARQIESRSRLRIRVTESGLLASLSPVSQASRVTRPR